MTVEDRIYEQIREHEHITNFGDEHHRVIQKYLRRDGAKTFPYLIKLMDGYNPRSLRDSGPFVATQIAVGIDENVARLRASEEGRRVIDAMKRLSSDTAGRCPLGLPELNCTTPMPHRRLLRVSQISCG